MNLSNWHVVLNQEDNMRSIAYGPLEEYAGETDTPIDVLTEIPMSDWTTDEIVEICGNILEDINFHKFCCLPNTLRDIMTQSAIPQEQQHVFFRNYMEYLFQTYGY